METNTPQTPPPARKPRAKKVVPIVQEEEPMEMGNEAEEVSIPDPDATFTFKRSHFYAVLVVLAFSVGILLGYVIWGRDTVTLAAAPSGPVAEAPVTPQPQYKRYDIPTDGYPSLGPDDAEIVIVEFSDFQCPFCRKFHDETYQALLDAYPGKIRFVYRNLPLTSLHPDAMPSAVASLCARDQNAYWDFNEKLFSNDTLDQAAFIQYATELGLNVDTFTACLSSGSHDEEISADMDFSLNLGVQSTPTFFINGLAIVGAQPLANFQQIINKELAGEIP